MLREINDLKFDNIHEKIKKQETVIDNEEHYKEESNLFVSKEDTSVSELSDNTNISELEENNSSSEDIENGPDSDISWEELSTNL